MRRDVLSGQPVTSPEISRQAVEIRVGEAVIRGQRWGQGGNWIVLVHDVGHDLDVWRDLPTALTRHGYAALLIDLPGHGLSDDPWVPEQLPEVLAAALAAARQAGAQRVFLVAAGTVAGRCLTLAKLAIDALVAMSPQLGTNSAGSLSDWPVLLLAGANDRTALAAVRAILAARTGWTVLSTFPVPEQGAELLSTAWSDHVTEQIALFLRPYATVA